MKNDNGKLKVRSKSTLDVDVNRRAGFWLPARPNGRSGRLGSEMQKSTFTFRSLYRQASERNGKIHFSVSERALPESFAYRQASERNGKIHFSVSERVLPESFAYVASSF